MSTFLIILFVLLVIVTIASILTPDEKYKKRNKRHWWQDDSGFEGLAVLLLGSLDVVFWRAEKEAVRNQVLGDEQAGAEERGVHPSAPALCSASSIMWAGLPWAQERLLWTEGNRAPGWVISGKCTLGWWEEAQGTGRRQKACLL